MGRLGGKTAQMLKGPIPRRQAPPAKMELTAERDTRWPAVMF